MDTKTDRIRRQRRIACSAKAEQRREWRRRKARR